MATYNPNINDPISIAENIGREISTNFMTTNNSISIAEDISLIILRLDVSVNDSITIAEAHSWNLVCNEYLSDSITTAEFLNLPVLLLVSVSESVTITEYLDVERYGLVADYYVYIQENVSVADSTPAEVLLYVYETESITIAESQAYGLSLIVLSISDSISIADTEQPVLLPLAVYDNVYIRDLFVTAIADAGINAVTETIAATQIVLASALRTADTYNSNAFKVSSALLIRWYFDVTAEAGASTLDITLQTSPDNLVWYNAVSVTQIIATGQYTTILTEPGIYVRTKCVVAGTSFTFAVKMTKHMPVRRFERKIQKRRRSLVGV